MELARYAEPGAVVLRAQKAMSALTGASFEAPKTKQAAPAGSVDPWDMEDEKPTEAPKESLADQEARKVAMDYFQKAAVRIGVSWEQFAAWAVMDQTQGVALSDVSVAELRTLAAFLKENCAP